MEFNKELFTEMLNTEDGKQFAEEAIAAGLKNKNAELLNKLSDKSNELSTYKSLGDVDELSTLVAEMQAAKRQVKEKEEAAMKANGDIEAIQKHFDEQLTSKDTIIQQMQDNIVNTKLESAMKSAITKAGGSVELLSAILRSRLSGQYNDGQVNIEVQDSEGNPFYVDGNKATISDLVEEFKNNPSYQAAFRPNGGQGSGTTTQSGVVKTTTGSTDPRSKQFDFDAAIAAVDKGTYTPVYKS